MSQALKGVQLITSEERPRILRYSNSAGPLRSKFLLYLRDHNKITGTKCADCGRVYVPARSTCITCFRNMEDLIEVSDEGTLQTFTIVYKREPVHPTGVPFAYGIIRLDGASTGLVHRLGEVEFNKIRIGMRVKAVYADSPKGDINDIKYFKPMDR
jgi:uncharacterized OB-fold protein